MAPISSSSSACSPRNPSAAPRPGLIRSGVLVFAQFVLFLVIGAMLFTFYQHTPLPRPLGRTDEVLPLFVVTSLPQGVSGFIVAAIVAAALSPSINSLAATTVNDFYLKYVRPDADEERSCAWRGRRPSDGAWRKSPSRLQRSGSHGPSSTRDSPCCRSPQVRCRGHF